MIDTITIMKVPSRGNGDDVRHQETQCVHQKIFTRVNVLPGARECDCAACRVGQQRHKVVQQRETAVIAAANGIQPVVGVQFADGTCGPTRARRRSISRRAITRRGADNHTNKKRRLPMMI